PIASWGVFGGSERRGKPIAAFDIEYKGPQWNAGQRLICAKCRDEGWIGENDATLTHRGKRDCLAMHQNGTERSLIDMLALKKAKSCAVVLHGDSLYGERGIAPTH